MSNSIKLLKEEVASFFEKGIKNLLSIEELPSLFNYPSVELSEFGINAINEKYRCRCSYLIFTNEDNSEMVILVCRFQPETDQNAISMYCVAGNTVYEYTDKNGNTLIPISDWKGLKGTKMAKIAIEFKDELIPKSLVPVTSGVGTDIVDYTRRVYSY